MRLITKSEFARLAGVTRQAIGNAIKEKRLDVIGEGRTAKINAGCYKSIQYIKIGNIQRDTRDTRDTPAGATVIKKLIKQKRVKTGQTIKSKKKVKSPAGKKPGKKIKIHLPPDKPAKGKAKGKKKNKIAPEKTKEIAVSDIPKKELEELLNLGARYEKARTGKIEQQELDLKLKNARTRGELVDREKVYNHLFTYLDKLHSNLERLADSFLSDVGPLIIDAGKLIPEHREQWKDEVLSQIDESKKSIVKMLKKIEKEQK